MNIKNTIISEIEKKLKKKININSTAKDLGIDSLEMLNYIVEIEEKFEIKISDDDLFKIETISDLILIVEKYVK